jgi:GNAT superfamily N-acetyltransferase
MEIRKAVRQDVPLILEFIKGIARYEKMENEVVATTELLEEQLFDKGRAEVIFAMEEGVEVGFALFFHNFSTFLGRGGLYLEDLFVYPEHRGKGYGKALFLELVRIANERGCGRMEWVCLNWNQPSIDFYLSMGAEPLNEWTTYRLNEQTIFKLLHP